jgi:hypothetical protein
LDDETNSQTLTLNWRFIMKTIRTLLFAAFVFAGLVHGGIAHAGDNPNHLMHAASSHHAHATHATTHGAHAMHGVSHSHAHVA